MIGEITSKMKISKKFKKVYTNYLNWVDVFEFCGTLNPDFEAIPDKSGRSAKECFYFIESTGKNYPTREPELLTKLLLVKASINFQIKEWAQGRADGTLPLIEFSKRQMAIIYPHVFINEECTVIEWKDGKVIHHLDVESQYKLPEWVVTAVEKQKYKFYKSSQS